MEQYREKLKLQNMITAICCVIFLMIIVIGILAEIGVIPFLTPATGDSHWHSRWRGFIVGAATGILALMIIGLIRSIRALKDETALKKMYVQANDERQIQIWTAARAQAMRTFILLGLAAGIIAGYFNITVSITIISCVVVHSVIGLLFKIYFSKKY